MQNDVIVIGAGAAGLMCAIEAGKRGRSVLIVEHNAVVGEKIRISGGGRCNFTNRESSHEHFVSANPHFCKSALARFTAQDFVRMVERHGIKYFEKKLGQLFCERSASEIITMLTTECAHNGVAIKCGLQVSEIVRCKGFTLQTSDGEYQCEHLVMATGGLSIPTLGATGFGYDVARQFGHEVITPRPALVPLLIAGEENQFYRELSGISLDAVVSTGQISFHENVLFTHNGLSGPAILQISNYLNPGDPLTIDFLPNLDIGHDLAQGRSAGVPLPILLHRFLPRRFVEAWCDRYGPSKPLSQMTTPEVAALEAQLHQWKIVPSGDEGFGKAEVTAGGVDTRGLSSKTMESQMVPGLFFVGEVVDVTGHLGGHNFQWAWSSGFAAGQYV